MSKLCKLFGHDLLPYGRLTETGNLYQRCRRCGEEQLVCKIDVFPKTAKYQQIESLIDKIRHAMDPVTEQEYLKELLKL